MQMAAVPLEYWENRWEKGLIQWHSDHVDPVIQKRLELLTMGRPNVSILVTLCGKTNDLPWLCEQGLDVVGVEFSEVACRQLFEEHSIPHSVTSVDSFTVYTATDRKLRFYVGDFYKVTPDLVGTFDAIWDCKAIVAINVEDRVQYSQKLLSLLKPDGRILMSTLEFNPEEHTTCPFSVPLPIVKEYFQDNFSIEQIEDIDLTGTSFTQRFKLTWARRPVMLLVRK